MPVSEMHYRAWPVDLEMRDDDQGLTGREPLVEKRGDGVVELLVVVVKMYGVIVVTSAVSSVLRADVHLEAESKAPSQSSAIR